MSAGHEKAVVRRPPLIALVGAAGAAFLVMKAIAYFSIYGAWALGGLTLIIIFVWLCFSRREG